MSVSGTEETNVVLFLTLWGKPQAMEDCVPTLLFGPIKLELQQNNTWIPGNLVSETISSVDYS